MFACVQLLYCAGGLARAGARHAPPLHQVKVNKTIQQKENSKNISMHHVCTRALPVAKRVANCGACLWFRAVPQMVPTERPMPVGMEGWQEIVIDVEGLSPLNNLCH